MDFKNKVTLITGSCGGIGHATALAFARAGANLVLVDIDSASGDKRYFILKIHNIFCNL